MATAAADVDLVNRALALLGVEAITSLADTSKPAATASVLFDDTRASVFRAHPWNCLIKRASLAQDAVAPAYGYTYKYALPADYLRLINIENDLENFQIENGFILYDEDTLNIKYVALDTDVTKYDPLLKDALAARLAYELAQPLLQSTSAMADMFNLYETKLKEARYVDAQENCYETLEADYFIESRQGLNRPNIQTPPRK